MRGEIIAIGDELTSGRILNSTSNFAARHLFAAGHDIMAMTTIGDDFDLIGASLRRALDRADFLVVTGGLGATSDDLTNEAVASAFELPVTFHPEIIEKFASHRSESADEARIAAFEKLAWLPEGAELLKPDARMAGHVLVQEGKPIFFLPGVPHEMKELLSEAVIPRLAGRQGQASFVVRHKLYKLLGVGETVINEQLRQIEAVDARVRIGYYPVFPEVHVSLTVRDPDRATADHLFLEQDAAVVELLEPHIFACNGDTMEGVVGQLLLKRHMSLAIAESCTGGLISHAVTRVSGSSSYFVGGVVAYSNELKERLLGVKHETLVRHGAVSGQTAREMAEGVRRATGADLGLSVTGIAGPSGGSQEKPVGTVYFGLASAATAQEYRFHIPGDRWKVQHHTSHTGLDLVRRHLLHLAG